MPRTLPPAASLADQLLEAQVRHHLDQLSGDDLDATVTALVDDLLDAAGHHRILDLVEPDAVKQVVRRALTVLPGSPAASSVADLVIAVVHDGPAEPHPIGELVGRDRVEVLLDRLLALDPVLERALERLTASPLVGTAASRFMGRIVGEVLQANRAITDKVPGLGSLMSFGTSAASRVMGAADKQFEGLIGDTVGKGGTFAVRRLNKIVIETLRDPTTREAALQVWDLLAAESVTGLADHVTREQLTGVVDAVRDIVAEAAASEPAGRFGDAVVDAFFTRFGDATPVELLAELALSRDELVADLTRLAPPIIEALRESGDLEQMLRARLEPFYASEEVRALLGGG